MKKNMILKLTRLLALVLVLTLCVASAVSCKEEKPDTSACETHKDEDGNSACDVCGETLTDGTETGMETNPVEPTEELAVDIKSAYMDVYEELQLTVSGGTGKYSYKSMQSEVAVVDENGLVKTLTVGNCEIQISDGESTLSCYLTVENSYSAPVVVISSTSIQISKDDEYIVSPILKFKGEDVTDDAAFEFVLADGSAGNVITSTQNGNTATFKGVNTGTTQYVVYVSYHGVQVSKVIDITVRQLGITFDAVNMTPEKGGYSVDLSLFAAYGYVTEFTPEVNVVNDKQIIDGAVITYSIADESIVKFENGKFLPVSDGTTSVEGSYQGNSFNITVNVIRPTIAVTAQNSTVEVGRLSEISFDTALSGEFQSVYIGEVSVGESIVDGKLNLSRAGLENMPIEAFGAPVDVVINTSVARYVSELTVYSLIIKTEEDYQSIGAISKAMFKDDDMMFGGYFILGNNITVTGSVNEFIDRGGAQRGIKGDGSQGFCGVFDGNGYIIDGLTRSGSNGNAFITAMHNKGVLKNIGFTNVTYAATAGSFLIHVGTGKIQDVYLQYKEIRSSGQYDATMMSAKPKVERVIYDASKVIIGNGAEKFALIGGYPLDILDNSFAAILPEGYSFPANNAYFNPNILNLAGNNTVINKIVFYNYASIKDTNADVYKSIQSWSPFIWHLDETTGVVTFGKTAQ